MKSLTIVDKRVNKHVDLFHLALLMDDELSLLPEIYEVFGDQALKFMDLFAGSTIRIPSPEQLEQSAKKVDVYLTLSRAKKGDRAEAIRELSVRYDMGEDAINNLFEEVEEYVKTRYRVIPQDIL